MRTRPAGLSGRPRGRAAVHLSETDGGTRAQDVLPVVLGILDGLGIQALPEQPLAEAGLDSLGKQGNRMQRIFELHSLLVAKS